MHDLNGTPLKVGDKVLLPAVVTKLYDCDTFCNVEIESLHGRRPDGALERIGAINTGVLVLLEDGGLGHIEPTPLGAKALPEPEPDTIGGGEGTDGAENDAALGGEEASPAE